ncbi:sugar ABC transporter substrate-binding protein [Paenibacillus tritici]|uniref:Sugar ABC transporter substrate-binding protein n=1 Tax=Paenibacillus tritici TaxID=1873425 RepID=A0ABX2DKV6_9BACL|nr:sugar ABC transporter substrate-binding protein [Paenibacillus tritici]NQX45232.1 sugar ABC transporter substrate-binding protein [Paenibacillus tritici]
MKNWMKPLIGISASAVLLAGCGKDTTDQAAKGTPASEQEVAIKFMLWNDSASERMYDELAQAFEAKNPGLTVDFTKSDANTYSERLTVTLTGGGEVDAFAFKSLDEYYKLASSGRALALDDYAAANSAGLAGVESSLDNLKINDKLYGLPFRSDGWALYYNKNLFDKAGVAYPGDDLTWEQYLELAKQMTSGSGQDKIYGSFMPDWAQTWYSYGQQLGASLYSEDLTPYIEGLKLRKELSDSGAQPSIAENKATNAHYRTAFLTGKYAMVVTGTWFPGMLEQDKKDSKLNFDWGMTYVPHPPEVKKGTTMTAVVVHAVSSDSKHQEEAKKWIGFISSEEGQQIVAKYQTPASAADSVKDQYKAAFTNDAVNLDAIFNITSVPERELRKGITQMNTIVTEEGELALLGESTPEKAIENIKKRRDQEIQ